MVSWGCLASKKARSVTCGMAMIRFFSHHFYSHYSWKIYSFLLLSVLRSVSEETREFSFTFERKEFNIKISLDSRKTKNLLIIMGSEMWALILWKFYKMNQELIWPLMKGFSQCHKKLVNWPLNKSWSSKFLRSLNCQIKCEK
jgi:hypothetical protein